MHQMDANTLYYGDNLEILRKYIPDNSIDLIYLDPPFKSNATYNVLFKEPSGKSSQAQITAFEDTWQWGMESERALKDIALSDIAPQSTKDFLSVLPNFVGNKTPMKAYLTMMAIRLIELRRVVKDTGSIYLHCDPTASHYLKILMDTIFSPANFRNEIIWKRSFAHGDTGQGAKHFGRVTDTILFYAMSDASKWNPQYSQYSQEALERDYKYIEPQTNRQYRLAPVDGPGGASKGNPYYEFKEVSGYWRFSKEKMQALYNQGRIVVSSTGKSLSQKIYLEEAKGRPIVNLWDDVNRISPNARERLGYPTQKPEILLERIIKASSNEGDVVLDPFCGCGTAIVAAQKLNRKWIGIDITHLAIGLMKWRLKNMSPGPSFNVIGEPKDFAGATELANQDKYQFQWWVVSLVGGQPYGDKKKGADTGIDGYLYYMDEKDKIKKAIISVKGGKNPNVSMIRDLGHVIDREKSDIGVFISLEKPTRPMMEEAAMKGFYSSPLGRNYPRLQILTVEEILQGKTPDIPPWIAPIQVPKTKRVYGESRKLL